MRARGGNVFGRRRRLLDLALSPNFGTNDAQHSALLRAGCSSVATGERILYPAAAPGELQSSWFSPRKLWRIHIRKKRSSDERPSRSPRHFRPLHDRCGHCVQNQRPAYFEAPLIFARLSSRGGQPSRWKRLKFRLKIHKGLPCQPQRLPLEARPLPIMARRRSAHRPCCAFEAHEIVFPSRRRALDVVSEI